MANALIVHPGTLVLSLERAKPAAQCINVWGYRVSCAHQISG